MIGRLLQRLFGQHVMRYEDYLGLYLNIGRVRARRTWETVDAHAICHTSDNLERGWFDAIADTNEEADALEEDENAARHDRRAKHQISTEFGVDF